MPATKENPVVRNKKIQKFNCSDIGLLYLSHNFHDYLPKGEELFFFPHPNNHDKEYGKFVADTPAGPDPHLYFPPDANPIPASAMVKAHELRKEDVVIRIPTEVYLEVNPNSELFVELPF